MPLENGTTLLYMKYHRLVRSIVGPVVGRPVLLLRVDDGELDLEGEAIVGGDGKVAAIGAFIDTSLDDNGERLALLNSVGEVQDEVEFDDDAAAAVVAEQVGEGIGAVEVGIRGVATRGAIRRYRRRPIARYRHNRTGQGVRVTISCYHRHP